MQKTVLVCLNLKTYAALCQLEIWSLDQVVSDIHTKIRVSATCAVRKLTFLFVFLMCLSPSKQCLFIIFSKQAAWAVGICKLCKEEAVLQSLEPFLTLGKLQGSVYSPEVGLGKFRGTLGSKEIKLKITSLPFL